MKQTVLHLCSSLLLLTQVSTGQSDFYSQSRAGTCPSPLNVYSVGRQCYLDTNCPGTQKCCPQSNTGASYCTTPLTTAIPAPFGAQPKVGTCPVPNSVFSVGPPCYLDTNCQGTQKCCPQINSGNAYSHQSTLSEPRDWNPTAKWTLPSVNVNFHAGTSVLSR